MLDMASYLPESQATHLQFFRDGVTASLGPHPRRHEAPTAWRSFMTDDNTPVELSWCWSNAADIPTVRYAVDPIGKVAGPAASPMNATSSARLLQNALPLAPEVDLGLLSYFQQRLTTEETINNKALDCSAEVPQSQHFMGFDLMEKSIVIKQYFLPSWRALAEGRSNSSLVLQAIRNLPGPADSLASSLDVVADYIESFPPDSQPVVEILAIDCLKPRDSRLKIYLRSRNTTLHSVVDMLTLGGRVAISDEGCKSLKELWRSVFDLHQDEHSNLDPLQENSHRTGGILYYFELKSNASIPQSKVYLPVRHYSRDDDQIARGLSKFLEARGKRLRTGSYYDGVKELWYVLLDQLDTITGTDSMEYS
ncbi:aromatic prenyltransferase [Aspergillus udagawae]|uniref:Aromatic prenyltransferase n=1 Tax=Aspergillus udagawae TaxID=91492 RepID=A0A8E0R3R0_9EURO|nr:aromatic prenyltransferase [Aspergillus udagawae]GIC94186.1 aromatic prenyltransferase [Aspergillus udagawae]